MISIAILAPLLRLAFESRHVARLRGKRLSAREIAFVPFKDFLMLAVWAIGFGKRRIDWRGAHALIGRGSMLTPVRDAHDSPGPASAASPG